MPNIVLVGYAMAVYDELVGEVRRVVTRLGYAEDSVITYSSDLVVTCCHSEPAPYAIVRCTDQKQLDHVAVALNEELGLGVEKELIQAYLEPNYASRWAQEGR